MAFKLDHPLPRRGITPLLTAQLVNYIIRRKLDPGAPFFSDNELVEATGLSRPTVRKCMEALRREGWIERRNGKGTFVGPRAVHPLSVNPHRADRSRASIRLMAAVFSGINERDTFATQTLEGIDAAAGEQGIGVELIVVNPSARKSLASRLTMSNPNVVVTIGANPEHTYLIAEAQRLDIPVIVGGVRLTEWELPMVTADYTGTMEMAVERLAALGHKRIGLASWTFAPRGFLERKGYLAGLEKAGLPADENGILWISDPQPHPEAMLEDYLKRWRPTAVIFSTGGMIRFLRPLIQSRRIRVPRDLSIVTETYDLVRDWLEGVEPTTACADNRTIGRTIAEVACRIARNEPFDRVTIVPGVWTDGESVTPI